MTGEGIAAFDPKVWHGLTRQAMLDAVGIGQADLTKAVKRHRKLLNAKKVKHFAHDGRVTDERILEDHEAQLRAVDLMYDLAGVKAPRAQAQAQAIGVAVEIDPVTGVVRVVAGTTGSGQGKTSIP